MQYAETTISAALQHFLRFQNLSPDELQSLARHLRVETAKPGHCLFRAGDNDRRDIFLISGELKLIADDGRSHLVVANSGAARQPIARLRPRQYTAVAHTTIEYFLIDSGHARPATHIHHRPHHHEPVPLAAMEVAEISLEAFQQAQDEYLQRRRRSAA